MKDMVWKRFLVDAVVGGVVVAVAVLIAGLFGPLLGGVIAGLPIRVGVSLLLIKFYFGETAAITAVRSALFGVFGAVVFVVSLYFLVIKCFYQNFAD